MPTTDRALRRSIPEPRGASPVPPTGHRTVDAVLRTLPSHGWTAGWIGRRDRALLVLRHQAGLSFPQIAALTVDEIRIDAGVAVVRAGTAEPVTLSKVEDCLICGPCALARWLHALDLAGLHSDGRVVASVIARAAPLTAHSPHACEGRTAGAPEAAGLRVFPMRDRWAPSPVPLLPSPSTPAYDLRARTAGHGRSRHGAVLHGRSDHAPTEATTVDPATALESRVRTLTTGSA